MLITNVTLVNLESLTENAALLVEGDKIIRIGKSNDFVTSEHDTIIDGNGAYLAPGLVDLHIHGTREYLIDNGPQDLAAICRILPQYGVTCFLPTVCPRPPGEDSAFLASLAQVQSEGTTMLGFHLEGPFLTLTGALPAEALGQATAERVESLVDAALPYGTVFSISPDKEGIMELLPIMVRDGNPAFITHTMATAKQTKAAIDLGATHATHFTNVFYPPEELEAGVRPLGSIPAIMSDSRATIDFILDGEHVDPESIKSALQMKGPGGVSLITDANIGAGAPPGRHQFFDEEVEITYPGGPARMTENGSKPGVLTGSGLTLDRAVRNAVEMLDVPVYQAIRMASTNPAAVLRLGSKGLLKEGLDADLVLLDQDLTVKQTWVMGKPMLNAEC